MKKEFNMYLKRYIPNSRYDDVKQTVVKFSFENFGDSITDKEAYRLSLLNNGLGSASSTSTPQYMFQDGKYNKDLDSSYLFRPDVNIVDVDNYKKFTEQVQKNLDERVNNAFNTLNKNKISDSSSSTGSSTSTGSSISTGSSS